LPLQRPAAAFCMGARACAGVPLKWGLYSCNTAAPHLPRTYFCPGYAMRGRTNVRAMVACEGMTRARLRNIPFADVGAAAFLRGGVRRDCAAPTLLSAEKAICWCLSCRGATLRWRGAARRRAVPSNTTPLCRRAAFDGTVRHLRWRACGASLLPALLFPRAATPRGAS